MLILLILILILTHGATKASFDSSRASSIMIKKRAQSAKSLAYKKEHKGDWRTFQSFRQNRRLLLRRYRPACNSLRTLSMKSHLNQEEVVLLHRVTPNEETHNQTAAQRVDNIIKEYPTREIRTPDKYIACYPT